MKKSTPRLVKMMNRELVVNELKKTPYLSRADLSKRTKLSKPTISEIVRELIEEDIILETGYGPSTGGKKPINLKYNARFRYVIGTMIENDTIFFALGDMNGDIINIFHEEIDPKTEAEIIVNLIVKGVNELIEKENIPFKKILGVVLGVSGIKMESEEIIRSSPTIDWGNINLQKELSNRLNKEVIIENDVNLMTIGEYYKGQAKNIQNFIYLFIGNGIGSGLFLNGEFYKGHHSASGEIGYMMVGNETKRHKDLGIFETNYGLFGILERLKEKGIPNTKGQSLLNYLQNNRELSDINHLLNEVIYNWAIATINVISIADPQAVIISGEFEKMDKISFNYYVETIEKYVPRMPEIKMTKLGSKAGIYGAFHHALNRFHMSGFKYNL